MGTTEGTDLTDAAAEALAAPSLCAAFQITAAARGDAPALRLPDDSVNISWAEYAKRVRALAEGFAALGVQDGGAVALLLANRPEANLCDTAAIHIGAASFSIYFTNPAEEIVPLLKNSGARVVVTETAYLDRILETRELYPEIDTIICVDGDGGDMRLEDVEGLTAEDFDFTARWQSLGRDHVVTLVYTSGTTGEPKGVQHTHHTLMYGLDGLQKFDPVTPNGAVVSYLPMAHIAERWISHYASMVFGHTITSCPDRTQLNAALTTARPTRLFGVPRVFEKIADGIAKMAAADPEGPLATGLAAGLARVRAQQESGGTDGHDPQDDGLSDEQKAALAAVREKLGLDRLEWTCVAAAPSAVATHEAFHAAGIPLLQIWGMSECIYTTCTPVRDIRLGTVGKAVPGVEVKLAEDGEILVKGPNVMVGYRNEPEKTAEAVDADGWLHSGDVARADAEGHLTIFDRKKELIINSSGKNMSPQKIEIVIKQANPLIGQVAAIGDGRPYVTALITLDPEGLAERGLDPAAAAEDEELCARVATAVETANEKLARVEQIKYHTLLGVTWPPG
ncbi:MAG: long-chain acyl-CoA synthetase, partial [Solirubrobacteraceae bacterium]|nr:long-chain acyl-CoA synthetase [Solirubrobacteraceae bacterium]